MADNFRNLESRTSRLCRNRFLRRGTDSRCSTKRDKQSKALQFDHFCSLAFSVDSVPPEVRERVGVEFGNASARGVAEIARNDLRIALRDSVGEHPRAQQVCVVRFLSSWIQSSSRSRKRTLCVRSCPSTNRPIDHSRLSDGSFDVHRGKEFPHSLDPKAPCPLDKVNRQFRADRPNQLWVSDFTYVSA